MSHHILKFLKSRTGLKNNSKPFFFLHTKHMKRDGEDNQYCDDIIVFFLKKESKK